MSREADYITEARQHVRKLWDAYHDLIVMQDEWNALDYATNLDDGTGENTGYTKAEVGSVVFDTINEIKLRIFDTAHKTNLAQLL